MGNVDPHLASRHISGIDGRRDGDVHDTRASSPFQRALLRQTPRLVRRDTSLQVFRRARHTVRARQQQEDKRCWGKVRDVLGGVVPRGPNPARRERPVREFLGRESLPRVLAALSENMKPRPKGPSQDLFVDLVKSGHSSQLLFFCGPKRYELSLYTGTDFLKMGRAGTYSYNSSTHGF
jgi:hypothetical protein